MNNPASNGEEYCPDKKIRCKTLVIHGGKYKTTFTKKFENRKKWEKPDEKKVISYIPGTILDVSVKAGEKVRKGENMLILEAMKMMNSITIPHDGIIKNVNVKIGDKIPKGFLMVEFE